MAIKIVIERKIKPGKLKELAEAVRDLRSKAVHAPGFISGETLRSIGDPSVHVVICTWKSTEDWNNWLNTKERKALQERIDAILEEPPRVNLYEYE
jgi:heme-degrading monooxygenase HmoA